MPLRHHTVPVTPFRQNASLVWCDLTHEAAVIDPGAFRDALSRAGVRRTPAPLDPTCFLVEHGDPRALPGFAEGWFAVQDQASAFVVRALDPRPGDRVLDACAAPGGKTTYACALVGDDGLVVGADPHPGRAGLIRRGVGALQAHLPADFGEVS